MLDLMLQNARLAERDEPVDIVIRDGVIVDLAPSLAAEKPSFNLSGALVCSRFAETHIHLDKACLMDRCSRHDGTLASAVQFRVCVFGMLVLSFAIATSTITGWTTIQPTWPAGVLAPFQYLEILGAAFLGAFIVGDLPDGLTAFGIAIIVVGSGLHVFQREQRAGARPLPTGGKG